MPSLTKVLFLEMDAAEHTLVRRWAAEGVMPNVQKLLARGVVGPTLAPEGFFVGSIWPSLTTGVSPAKHGVHSWEQIRPGTYEFFRAAPPDYIKREPFWKPLSRAGRRLAVFDMPLSGVFKKINGIQTGEWGAHDAMYGFRASSPELKEEILRKFGAAPSFSCDGPKTPRQYAEFRDRLVDGIRRKGDLTCHYLSQGGWDFFGQVFTESHCAGHQCWHLHDHSSPHFDPAVFAAAGDVMKDVYAEIDKALGRILSLLDDETVTILLLGHGMGHAYGAYYLFPQILLRLGVAKPRARIEEASGARATKHATDSALSTAWRLIPESLKDMLRPWRDRMRDWIDHDPNWERPGGPRHIDLANSACFTIDNNHAVSTVRMNLVGREPDGIIHPGQEADAFCEQLARDLLEIRDLDRNIPAFIAVKKTADVYQGDALEALPDLLAQWNPELPVGKVRLSSPKIGVLEGKYGLSRTGEHRREGLFVATGRGLEPRLLNRTVSVMDFAPTFTRLLGVELEDVDGQPIAEILGRVDA
jgi:predicted AlkP superfamily phosphohydrolase/phosphomutase